MSVSNISTDEKKEATFDQIVKSTVVLFGSQNDNGLIAKWATAHEYACTLAVAYEDGLVSGITDKGEALIRQAFGVLANLLEKSDYELFEMIFTELVED